jgi:AcrR family transcriptional regulator
MTDVETRLYTAALDLLRTRGPAAVSVEAVAAHSGVAKTTIYRRFDGREPLLEAAVLSAAAPVPMPDVDSRELLRWVLMHARDTIEDVIGRGTVAAVLVDDDPAFTRLLLGMIRSTTRPFREELRRRVEAGELRAGLDVELAISMLLGVVVAEVIRGRVTDGAWADEVLTMLAPAFGLVD